MRFKLTYVVFIFLLVAPISCGQGARQPPQERARQSPQEGEPGIPGPPAPKASTQKVEDVSASVDRSRARQQAQEMTDAFIAGNFEKMADLTYPDLVALLGGKAKMVAQLKRETAGWREQGMQILAMPVDEPQRVVKARDYLLAVLPATMRIKMPDGVYAQRTAYLGVSRDDGRTWTFVDARDGSKQKLKVLFATIPTVIDELELPSEQPPVRESDR